MQPTTYEGIEKLLRDQMEECGVYQTACSFLTPHSTLQATALIKRGQFMTCAANCVEAGDGMFPNVKIIFYVD